MVIERWSTNIPHVIVRVPRVIQFMLNDCGPVSITSLSTNQKIKTLKKIEMMERIAPFVGSHLPAITIIIKAIAFNAGITHAHDESIIPEKGIYLPLH